MQYLQPVALLTALASCGTARVPASTHAQEVELLKADLARVEHDLQAIKLNLTRLEAVSGPESVHEFTELTIDERTWNEYTNEKDELRSDLVLAHVKEWRDFPALKLFTQLADNTFYFEAEGRAPIEGRCGVGGMSNPDGSVRCAVIHPGREFEPGVVYRLRARNQDERYRWVIVDGVAIAGK